MDGSNIARELPNATESEQYVLSMCLQEEHAHYMALAEEAGITVEAFYVPAHRTIFGVLSELHSKGTDFDLLTVTQLLKDRGLLENIGGSSKLTEIYIFGVSGALFAHKVAAVLAKYAQRQTIAIATRAIQEAYEATSDTEACQAISSCVTSLTELRDGVASDQQILSSKQVVREVWDSIEKRMNKEDTPMLETPWANLNASLGGGLGYGEITFVAARPSVGKTALAMNLIQNASLKLGVPSLMVSCESSTLRLGYRMVSSESGLTANQIGRSIPEKGELAAILAACKKLAGAPFWLRKIHNAKSGDVARCIRTAVREHGVKLVVLDYLQLIKASSGAEIADQRLRIDNALDTICPLADQLGIALVILVQLNREAEGLPANKLRLNMLKESSRIEQDGDTIALLGPGHDYEGDGPDCEPVALQIAKNRDGERSLVRLQLHGPTTTFRSHFTNGGSSQPSEDYYD